MTSGWLERLERAGNRLPDPATLFLAGTLVVMTLSHIAWLFGWSVQKTVERDGVSITESVTAVSLLASDGLWWTISHLVDNFVSFPPLGLVLVALLGIGLAERSGLLPVLLHRLLGAAPAGLLVPATIFVGISSSLAAYSGRSLPPIP